jgi:hypothetical protein
MDDRGVGHSERITARDEREQRLAAALRANLLRRKRQASERSRGSEADRPAGNGEHEAGATPHDSAEIVADKKTD